MTDARVFTLVPATEELMSEWRLRISGVVSVLTTRAVACGAEAVASRDCKRRGSHLFGPVSLAGRVRRRLQIEQSRVRGMVARSLRYVKPVSAVVYRRLLATVMLPVRVLPPFATGTEYCITHDRASHAAFSCALPSCSLVVYCPRDRLS